MISIEEVKSKLANILIPENGFIFTAVDSVFFGKNQDGFFSFGKKVENKCRSPLIQNTTYLDLMVNQTFAVENEGETQLSVVVLKTNETRLTETFLRLSMSIASEMSDEKFYDYFLALKEIFSNSKERSEQELQGFYAELYVLKYLKESGKIDLSYYYQSQEKMKFDYSISGRKKVEIKSTLKKERVHHFRQEQLNSLLYDVMVFSLLLRKDDKGLSLYDLICFCRGEFKLNLSFISYLEKFIHKTEISTLQDIKFNEEYTKKALRIIKATSIPKVDQDPANGVYNVEFDSNLENCAPISVETFAQWVKNV